MIERSRTKNNVDVLTPSSEEERLREQVRKLFRQLESQDLEFQEKEEALKQTVSLLAILARAVSEPELRPLIEQLWREVKRGAQPSTVTLLITDIKDKVSLETLQALEHELRPVAESELESGDTLVLADAAPTRSRHAENRSNGKPEGKGASEAPRVVPSSAQDEQEMEGKVRALLGFVAEQLRVDGEKGLDEKLTAVKVALAEKGLLRRLADVRLQMADLLKHYREFHDGERARLEELLKDLIKRLAEIEKNVVAGLMESHKEAVAGNAEFTEQLEGQVAHIQEVAYLKDLDAVRKAITNQTDRMRDVIEAKREADAKVSAAFEAKVRYLESQLHDANSQLSNMTERAYRDSFLEGVYNRLAFNEKLHQEMLRFERYQQVASLVLFDLDRFKQVNDTYGHQAGDHALRAVVAHVRPMLRDPDIFARFGGDEFALILPNTALSGAITVAERLRDLVSNSKLVYENEELQISLSLGVATVQVGDSLETWLERADRALYLAKERGRNQVRSEAELPSAQSSSPLNKMVGFLAGKFPLRKGKNKE